MNDLFKLYHQSHSLLLFYITTQGHNYDDDDLKNLAEIEEEMARLHGEDDEEDDDFGVRYISFPHHSLSRSPNNLVIPFFN